ncbi:MAG: hypothetical protein ACRD0L_09915, partial [Acidimicrobiales bacterium]
MTSRSLAGTGRTLVAVGMARLAFMLAAIRAGAPRSGVVGGPLGSPASPPLEEWGSSARRRGCPLPPSRPLLSPGAGDPARSRDRASPPPPPRGGAAGGEPCWVPPAGLE